MKLIINMLFSFDLFQNVKENPINRSIISQLFDLISDDIFFEECYPHNVNVSRGAVTKSLKSSSFDSSKKTTNSLTMEKSDTSEKEDIELEISSSRTIKWCSSIALHLLQLSLNINTNKENEIQALNLY